MAGCGTVHPRRPRRHGDGVARPWRRGGVARARRGCVVRCLGAPARSVVVDDAQPAYDDSVAATEGRLLTLRRLEDHLWQAADLFRNKVSNQKDYILALLFFKRASDLYEEEVEVALAEIGDVPNADELARDRAFHVVLRSEGHSWDDVRNTDEALSGSGAQRRPRRDRPGEPQAARRRLRAHRLQQQDGPAERRPCADHRALQQARPARLRSTPTPICSARPTSG